MKYNSYIIIFITIIISLIFFACNTTESKNNQEKTMDNLRQSKSEIATFGSGCFWCTEAIFERVKGVQKVISGYSGGITENPSYEEVCTGTTGHAECTQIYYDPTVVSYDELLEIFWKTHDPTTLNRQGNDVGTQYRSVIFYHNQEQKQKAEYYKKKLEAEKIWDKPIVTEITEFRKFYPAEDYHQNYYDNNPGQGYCAFVITPKIEKFEKIFKDKMKK
ncbi:peptide-methionine (S)-S-oxide reductase MsrA [Ignavibacterium album]|uniref:peptide-methionine (S)-S-oxide reductase MsrA n=1 Tax=Ignavibacterium album TaxID=591197 RepID=UPI0038B3E73D